MYMNLQTLSHKNASKFSVMMKYRYIEKYQCKLKNSVHLHVHCSSMEKKCCYTLVDLSQLGTGRFPSKVKHKLHLKTHL